MNNVESPIEYMLLSALSSNIALRNAGVSFVTQVPMAGGRYRADIVAVGANGVPLCVVECDGKKFHNPANRKKYDSKRDKTVAKAHGVKTLRFSGTNINKDPYACAEAVARYIIWGIPVPRLMQSHKKMRRKV